MAAWMPLVFATMSALYQLHRWLALLYLLVVGQAAHMIEHLAQMVQLHILGWPTLQANGIIGALNIEWVHLIWNSWVLLLCMLLLYAFRRNPWVWMLFIMNHLPFFSQGSSSFFSPESQITSGDTGNDGTQRLNPGGGRHVTAMQIFDEAMRPLPRPQNPLGEDNVAIAPMPVGMPLYWSALPDSSTALLSSLSSSCSLSFLRFRQYIR